MLWLEGVLKRAGVSIRIITVPTLSGVMQVVFINECRSCEISNQMSFNIMFSFSKQKMSLLWHKYQKKKLFSGAFCMVRLINQSILEPSYTSTREHFCKNS